MDLSGNDPAIVAEKTLDRSILVFVGVVDVRDVEAALLHLVAKLDYGEVLVVDGLWVRHFGGEVVNGDSVVVVCVAVVI